jgi:putative nucleotidyltransferase with HDIG domain
LLRISYHLSRLAALGDLLRAVLDDAVSILQARRGFILLADALSGKLRVGAVSAAGLPVGTERALSKSLARRCFHKGQSIVCHTRGEGGQEKETEGRNTASVLCALLRTPRQRLGVLYLDRAPGTERFTTEDLRLADALAGSVSVGLESAQLLQQQREQAIHTVTALAQAVEMRDRYTGGHTQRVTTYALLLAEELQLSGAAVQQLRIGTPLHDIGKIGIDDAILRKPGKLTAAEFEQMKTHTVKGAAVLETIPELTNLIPIIRSHHERWDGQGYPDRLTGGQIPLLPRIVAVVDAFDALTSDRPYRPAWTVDQAFAQLTAESGTHFDPACVAGFLRVRPRVQALLDQEGSMRQLSGRLAETFGFDVPNEAKNGD